jgi:hypothetical protein
MSELYVPTKTELSRYVSVQNFNTKYLGKMCSRFSDVTYETSTDRHSYEDFQTLRM